MTAPTIPTIETPRLRLRPPVAEDFAAFARFRASPRAAHLGGPRGPRADWGAFCHGIACWALFGHGALMIDQRDDGACIGLVDISHGPLFPEKELGWLLYDGAEGRGYATEAAAALRDWAYATLQVASLVSYIDPDNTRSIAVAERLGARRDPGAVP